MTDIQPSLMEVQGLELEYMIVSEQGLDTMPISDLLLQEKGEIVPEIDNGILSWSNEFFMHVIEIKNSEPVHDLATLETEFLQNVSQINQKLAAHNARLLPTGMHPWFNPALPNAAQIWPHHNQQIYQSYHEIFDCQAHGWANLQSAHLNLSFGNEQEFGRLLAAIRLIMPIMPAMSASSPFIEGKIAPNINQRLDFYRFNQKRIPEITGGIIPEPIYSIDEYKSKLLTQLYRAIDPYDKLKVLQHEWLNSRGAIARFDRSAIEIRILDTQESPLADIAMAIYMIETLKLFTDPEFIKWEDIKNISNDVLEDILIKTIRHGGNAVIDHPEYLKALHASTECQWRAIDLWNMLYEMYLFQMDEINRNMDYYDLLFAKGNLSDRILSAYQKNGGDLHEIYLNLALCLEKGIFFDL